MARFGHSVRLFRLMALWGCYDIELLCPAQVHQSSLKYSVHRIMTPPAEIQALSRKGTMIHVLNNAVPYLPHAVYQLVRESA